MSLKDTVSAPNVSQAMVWTYLVECNEFPLLFDPYILVLDGT